MWVSWNVLFTVGYAWFCSLSPSSSSSPPISGPTGGVVGLAMACSNTFELVTGAFLLGFGLSEIPRSIWKNAYWINHQKVLSHEVAKMAVCLHNAHQGFPNATVLYEDPTFKPSGGRSGENDMDYDIDERSMFAHYTRVYCFESLDEIFQRLKQHPSRDHNNEYGYGGNDDDMKFRVIQNSIGHVHNRNPNSNLVLSYQFSVS